MSIPAEQRAQRLAEMMADPDPWWRTRLSGLAQLIEKVKPETVLEIGCCRGHSTELFLMYAERVVALDPWPSAEDDPSYFSRESLGGDEFDEFTARCSRYRGLEVVRGRSPQDVNANWRFDLVYIDGDHAYEAVVADIAATHRLCRVLAGHDYNIPSVRLAVMEYCLIGGLQLTMFPDMSWMIEQRREAEDVAA